MGPSEYSRELDGKSGFCDGPTPGILDAMEISVIAGCVSSAPSAGTPRTTPGLLIMWATGTAHVKRNYTFG